MTGQACLVMALYVQLSQPEDLFIFSLQNIIPIEFLFLHICKIILIQLPSVYKGNAAIQFHPLKIYIV